MCRLKIKIRLTGKRNQKCVRFILVPKDFHQKSNYILSFGYWDLRDGPQYRFIVFNIYKLMYYYMQGATPNRVVLTQIYKFFTDIQNLSEFSYFKEPQMLLFLENEIKKKNL